MPDSIGLEAVVRNRLLGGAWRCDEEDNCGNRDV